MAIVSPLLQETGPSKFPVSPSLPLILGVVFLALLCAMFAGCGYTGSTMGPAVALSGSVHGGRQPVSGASIQLYAAGSKGTGSAAQSLLSTPSKTDSSGNFTIPAAYGCPSATSQIYVVARGGNPGVATSSGNTALVLTAMLGSCSSLASSGPIDVNEVTTVGSVWPVAQFMKSSTELGAAAADPSFAAAVASIPEFINVAAGSSPGAPTATSYFAENAKLYSLADLLADCVNSTGGSAGDGSACGRLFTMATPSSGTAPADTLTAAMNIAQNPDNNVSGIFGLVSADTPFQPLLSSAPADWTLNLAYLVATPAISLASGTYAGTQQVTISDSTPGSAIYYTTDGTVPTSASLAYEGPISISVSVMLQATAFLKGSASAVAASSYTISAPAPPARLAFLQQPRNAIAGTNLSPAVQVVVEDGNGNAITGAANPVTLTLSSGDGLTGALTVTPQNGVATFSNLSVSAAGSYTLSATSPGLTTAISSSFTVSAPPVAPVGPAATQLLFLQQPSNAATYAAIAPAVQVAVEDGSGNKLATATNPVTLVLVSSAGIGSTLWTALPQNGIATFNNLMASTAGGYTLSASSPGLSAVVSTPFTITAPSGQTAPPATQLSFLQQPTNALTGATLSPAVQVVVEDSNGNAVTTATNPITLTLGGGTGLGGTLTVTPQNGVAMFGNLSVSNAGTGYTLSAASVGLTSAVSSSFTISAPSSGHPPAPVKLAFSQQPSNALTGATITPAVTVTVEDANGNQVLPAANAITLTLSGGTGLAGTLTATAQNGVATFSGLSVNTAGSGYTLTASSPTLASATSSAFTISAPGNNPTPAKLIFLLQPANAATGATMATVTVAIEDSNGVTVSTAVNPVTLALSGGGLTGTLNVAAQNGIASFHNLSVSAAGTYTLSATSPSLAAATSASFTINAPVVAPTAVKLAFLQEPTDAMTGAAFAPAIKVMVEDGNGNLLASATNPVTLALSAGTGLGGTLTATPQNGVATFANLAESNAGSYFLLATSPGLVTALSTGFTVSAPVVTPTAVKLAFAQQPSNALTGAVITPAVTVVVEDSSGNTVSNATNPITLTLSGGSGLGGTLTATPQNGIATFSNLSVSAAGSSSLSASSPGLTTALSAGFTITTPVVTPFATTLVFAQQPSNALTGASITPAVTVKVEDSGGNLFTSATNPVTLALTGGSGLGGTLTVTPQNGIATFSNLFESTAGNYSLSATSPGLTTAISTGFTVTAPMPTATKLVFAQQPSNALTGATITPAVTVLVEDSSGTMISGAANPVTLSLVSGSGLSGTVTVTAQNGVATFANLSETTAGNYNLSAASAGLSSASSTGFTITAPVVTPTPTKLAFSQQPSNALTGASITPAVTVLVQDSSGNTVTGSTTPVTLALTSGSGLTGTLIVTPQNGVATFSNLSETVAGTYTLSATSPGLSSASSSSFIVSVTASCSITSFGAVGDGVTNNASAIQNTFNYAATHNCTVVIPAGTFAYSGVITASGIAVTGTGAASILKAQDTNNEALSLTGNGGSISNLVMLGTGSTRTFSYQAALIWINHATNFTVENVLVNGASCVGIYDSGGVTGLIQNNTVENTLADSLTNTDGAHSITVKGNHVLNSGDDGVSNNSYLQDSSTVHDIMVEGNTIIHNHWGRGLEVSGGSNITFQGNYVDNLDGYTDMYVASEEEYKTQNVSNITVTGNTFVDGGPNQGSAIIYNSEAGSTTITGVTITGNQFVNPKAGAVQFAGNGSETGIAITDNTDFSTSAFSFSSNPTVAPTMTRNQVLAPSIFTTPLVPPGGGCSFAGC